MKAGITSIMPFKYTREFPETEASAMMACATLGQLRHQGVRKVVAPANAWVGTRQCGANHTAKKPYFAAYFCWKTYWPPMIFMIAASLPSGL